MTSSPAAASTERAMGTERTRTERRIGVVPLSSISAGPAEYLTGVAAAGYDFVGVRLAPVTPEDIAYTPGGADFRLLKSLVADTGLEVFDAEVFALGPDTSRDDWLPILQMAAELGVSYLNVVGTEPDMVAFEDAMGRLAEDAREFRVMPLIEPIQYRPMDSYTRAIEIARAVGCGVEIDGLHALRTGADLDLVAANSDLFPVFQLCDAPAEVRRWGDDRPAQAKPEDDDRHIEARLNRLLPGRGDSPLVRMLHALQPGTPVSVEIPNLELQARMTVHEYLAFLYAEAKEFIRRADAPAPRL